jgi:adenylosuccinate lyase
MLKNARSEVMLKTMNSLIKEIEALSKTNASLAMLSRTHGQVASPTTLGKELKNVSERLKRQLTQFEKIEILGKFNGAVGNFNAHHTAYPRADWVSLSSQFLDRLGLKINKHTTQIEPHDYVAELFDCLKRFNQVLLDFDRDIWSYVSIDYFKQKKVEGETGSSTMPHKINPIDFENSEGNLGIANALLEHMSSKLVISRLQRDLSDSTVLRNIGSALGHCVLAYKSTLKGLTRLEVNEEKISEDLSDSWEVLAEPVQTVMRKYGMTEPYERLKKATRGRQLDENSYHSILKELNLPEKAMNELKSLKPEAYTGLATQLTNEND